MVHQTRLMWRFRVAWLWARNAGREAECTCVLDSSLPFALADPHRLQQCLTALVDNALLYTEGPVILAASSGPCMSWCCM